jgi:amidase
MPANELCLKSATEQRRLIATHEISCVELLDAHLRHIEAVNPLVNAIVTLVPEQALKVARELDGRLARGQPIGTLGGLPVAHKDLFATKGIRTTYGSRLFADYVPAENALVVDRLQQAGAVTIGKTNTPEWGAGSQTFNDVFGATLNPYDTRKTCGGSSGGAATALAARLVPIADGSDMGGSLRNPASFCNIVGFRTSPGRVPVYPATMGWFPLGVTGPMARNVSDCALLLSAMAGPDPMSPIGIETAGSEFLGPLRRDFTNVPIAFSPNFGAQIPVAKAVRTVIETAATVFEDLGCIVARSCPDFEGADETFKTLRAWSFAAAHEDNIKAHPELLKDTIIWNVEQGLALTGAQVAHAEAVRTALYHQIRLYMQNYEFLVLPVAQVAPFDIDIEWVRDIEGTQMTTYIDWMKSCYFISILGLPAISVPCGFTEDGLPVGVQIVGRHHADFSVLQLAWAFEQATTYANQLPAIVAP